MMKFSSQNPSENLSHSHKLPYEASLTIQLIGMWPAFTEVRKPWFKEFKTHSGALFSIITDGYLGPIS